MKTRDRPFAVAGGGSIGLGMALVFARGGRTVSVFEPDPDRRERFPRELRLRLTRLSAAGLLAEKPSAIARRAAVTPDLRRALEDASYVQECVPEHLGTKRELFSLLDAFSPPDAVLASSSSALPMSRIAEDLPGARRCLIAHPGNPPYLLPVIELVPSPVSEPAVVDAAERLLRCVGMSPVRLKREIEGFIFNRLQGAVLREAYCLVRDGVASPQDIDQVMREGLGRRWAVLGPFEVAELNTRGGIEAHARVQGPAYARMGAERGQHDPWGNELVAAVSEAVQERFPRHKWEENVEWRDRALMALEKCRRGSPLLAGPGPARKNRKSTQ